MRKKLITLIIGTRPEAIKLAPLIKNFQKSNIFNTRIVLTGQHQEMVYQVLSLFKIKEDKNLEIMSKEQTLESITSLIINKMREEFLNYTPELVVVQGDTSSAFVAALSAFYQKIPVAHVEAGLRTNNNLDPYPEEINRRLISQIASLHFAPTKNAQNNTR